MSDLLQDYQTLGEVIARIVSHAECPAYVAEKLSETITDISNEASRIDAGQALAIQALALPSQLQIIGAGR